MSGAGEDDAANPHPFIPRSRERSPDQIARDGLTRRRLADVERENVHALFGHDRDLLVQHLAAIDLGEQQADEVDALEAAKPSGMPS